MFNNLSGFLSESEYYSDILNNLLDSKIEGILLLSTNFDIVAANKKAIQVLELDKSKILEKKITEIINFDKIILETLNAIAQNKLDESNGSFYFQSKNSNFAKFFSFNISKINLQKNDALVKFSFQEKYHYKTNFDDAALALLLNSANSKIYILNSDYEILKIYGSDTKFYPNATPNDNASKIFSDEIVSFIKRAFDSLQFPNEYISKDFEIYYESEKKFFYELTAYKLFLPQANNEFLIIIAQNISLRKALENQLTNSLTYYKTILEDTLEIIFTINHNYQILTYNSNFENIFSKAYQTQIAKNVSLKDIIPKNKFYIWQSWINKAFFGDHFSVEYEFEFQINKSIYKFDFYPLKNNNTISSILVIGKDITENKIAEKKLIDYINQVDETRLLLEKKNKELETLNERLTKSEQELKELNESKDKFMSVISHDLRSPFHSLLSSAELLSNEANTLSTEEIKLFSKNIFDISKRIFDLLENLLMWSRSQLGKIAPEFQKIKTKQLLDKVLFLMNANIQKKDIVLIINIKEDFEIYVDINMMFSVFQNLLSNAIKFTPNGGTIIVEANKSKEHCIIKIEDSGVGISQEKLKNLFSISGVKSTPGTNHEKGSGLGLVLCKEFVEKNKGEIWVESEVNKGTKFYIKLPLQ